MEPGDHKLMDEGFEDRITEHEVDDEVYAGQVKNTEDQEKPDAESVLEKTE